MDDDDALMMMDVVVHWKRTNIVHKKEYFLKATCCECERSYQKRFMFDTSKNLKTAKKLLHNLKWY